VLILTKTPAAKKLNNQVISRYWQLIVTIHPQRAGVSYGSPRAVLSSVRRHRNTTTTTTTSPTTIYSLRSVCTISTTRRRRRASDNDYVESTTWRPLRRTRPEINCAAVAAAKSRRRERETARKRETAKAWRPCPFVLTLALLDVVGRRYNIYCLGLPKSVLVSCL